MYAVARPQRPRATAANYRNQKQQEQRNLERPPFWQYANDPAGFIQEVLGDRLTDDQIGIANSVRLQKETNVQAGHGLGKSFLGGRLALWFTLAVGGLAITTAPTKRQVEQILWGEIRSILDAHEFGGEHGITFYRLTENYRAFGFTASKRDSNAFQGIHRDKLLVIQDEACGISQEIDDGAVSCATGSLNRILRIGNPIVPNTPFEKSCSRNNIRMPVWSHPNVSWAYEMHGDGIHRLKSAVAAAVLGEDGKVKPQTAWPQELPRDEIPGAVSIAWIEDIARPKGEQSAFWQSRVEGLFPQDAASAIIPRALFQAARLRYDHDPEYWDEMAKGHEHQFGLDVGDGDDPHALARWRGPVLYSVRTMPTMGDYKDVERAKNELRRALDKYGGRGNVDRVGVGAGAVPDYEGKDWKAYGIHWGRSAKNKRQFINRKAEDFWLVREGLESGELAIASLGEHEDELMDDWAGTYWETTTADKTRIEDKAKTKDRLKRSPNLGDAAVVAKAVARPPRKRRRVGTMSGYR